MKRPLKITVGIISTIVLLLIAFGIFSYSLLKKSLPVYDRRLSVIGLKGEVKIYRDSYAIPMISAVSEDDAAFALGYLHAQERLFQMDIARRAGEGRLSEVFGEKTLPFDRMFRTVGIYRNVKRNMNKLNPATLRVLKAYSAGVNAYIKEAKGKYPVEFDALGYEPYEWKPEHSLVIVKMMAWELNISWWVDISFTHLVQKFGIEKVKEILPDFPENAPTIIPKAAAGFSGLNENLIKVDRDFRKFIGAVGTHIGSNNWVVNGKKSVSGKPIIANDPHLAFSAPGKWYFAIIKSSGWNAEGFTLPGVPEIVIGKNENISWVMTNVMADDADFYAEKLNEDQTKYFYNGEWNDLKITADSIRVKGLKPEIIQIKETHRGPLISDIHPSGILFSAETTLPLSMRWTGNEFSDEVYAAIKLNHAKNWNDFREALRDFTVPGQNFVYADKEGNIGYICAARLPIRKNNSSTFVNDGTTADGDWQGFVPYDEMPKMFNPPENFIASANNKTVQNFEYHISNIWEPSSRIERITELLKSKEKHSAADFGRYQNDFYSYYAKEITPYVTAAFNNVKITDKNLRTALDLLGNWDYMFNAESQTPAIFTRFFQFLLKNIFEDEMGSDLFKEYVFVANVPYRVIQKMFAENSSSFFDNIKTSAVESRDDIIRKSLSDAMDDLESEFGKDIAGWQWENVHKVRFRHMFHGVSPLLDNIIDIGPFPVGGDGTTIFNTEYDFSVLYEKDEAKRKLFNSEPYENNLGPSMRYIFDFADPDNLEFILPAGQSGQFMSGHYKDMTDKWLRGEYINVPLRIDKFIERSEHLLILSPM